MAAETISSSDVGNELNTYFGNPTLTTPQKIAAINAAIRFSWPELKLETRETAEFALASSTFEYTLTTLAQKPVAGWGIDELYVADYGDRPKRKIMHWYQYFNGTNWVVGVTEKLALQYSGQSVDVVYFYRHPTITVLAADDLKLPFDYVFGFAAWWWAGRNLTQLHTKDGQAFAPLVAIWEEQWREAKRREMVMPKPANLLKMPPHTLRPYAYNRRVLE